MEWSLNKLLCCWACVWVCLCICVVLFHCFWHKVRVEIECKCIHTHMEERECEPLSLSQCEKLPKSQFKPQLSSSTLVSHHPCYSEWMGQKQREKDASNDFHARVKWRVLNVCVLYCVSLCSHTHPHASNETSSSRYPVPMRTYLCISHSFSCSM